MHDWKRVVDRRLFGRKDLQSSESPIEILNKLRESLKPILYKTDIEEVFNQYLTDFHSIQRSTTTTVSPINPVP